MGQSMCLEIQPELMVKSDWDIMQEYLDASMDQTQKEIAQLAYDLAIPESCAMDVWYLRTRSRHTPELELQLIALHRAGTPPNINEFGHNF